MKRGPKRAGPGGDRFGADAVRVRPVGEREAAREREERLRLLTRGKGTTRIAVITCIVMAVIVIVLLAATGRP